MENVQVNHQLHAIRMKWLNWLSRPIIAVWDFIVDSFMYLWSMITLAWNSFRKTLNYRYWVVSAAGVFASLLLIYLFFLLSYYSGQEVIIVIGIVLSVLPMAWTYGAVAFMLESVKDTDEALCLKNRKDLFAGGMKTIKFIVYYVLIIVALIALELLVDSAGLIPYAGLLLMGIFFLPLVIASALIILSALIIIYGLPMMATHVLKDDMAGKITPGKFMEMSWDLIKIIGNKWLDIAVVSIPALLFGILAALLPAMLLIGSLLLTGAVGGILGIYILDFSNLSYYISNLTLSENGFEAAGLIILMISMMPLVAIVAGIYITPLLAAFNSLYHHQEPRSLIRRLMSLLVIYGIFSLVITLMDSF